ADAIGRFRNGVEMGGVLGRELRQRRPVERRRSCSEQLGPVLRGHANAVRGRSCPPEECVGGASAPPPPGPEGPAVLGPIVARSVPPATQRPTLSRARAISRSPSPRPARRRA